MLSCALKLKFLNELLHEFLRRTLTKDIQFIESSAFLKNLVIFGPFIEYFNL